MFICEITLIIILIFQKLGLAGPIQQKIKLPLPYTSDQIHLNGFLCKFNF